MDQAQVQLSPLAAGLVLVVGLASLTAFVVWVRVWLQQGYVLHYEPRHRPPWGVGAGALAAMMTLLGLANLLAARTGDGQAPEFVPAEFVSTQVQMCLLQILFTAAIVAALFAVVNASWRDLGWPTTAGQFGRDIRMGVWIGLASMVPLYLLQVLAMSILQVPPGHPLLDQMASTPDAGVFAAVMFAAVVAAPPFEEIVFRLLLQGGLERWEDEQVAWPLSYFRRAPQPELAEAGHVEPESSVAPGSALLAGEPPTDDYGPVEPGGRGMFGGLGHGWGPILASSFLFAVAHLGNGPSPIALFVFGMFLGYAYQRTHRILPCIAAHATLNCVSVLVMILSVSGK